MPTSASSKFPVPKSWDELEVIVWDLLRREWADPFAVRHGRIGQRQDGVDIYGKPAKSKGAIHGVQVRGKTEQYGAKLTERELRDAVAEAQKFCPSLEAFYVVTSVPRDASVQKAARLLTEEHRAEGAFAVHVWGWEDIEERLASYPELQRLYYPQFFGSPVTGSVVETKHPNLVAHFDNGGRLIDSVLLELAIPAPTQDIDSLLMSKKDNLLKPFLEARQRRWDRPVSHLMDYPDPEYPKHVEAYLEGPYRDYLGERQAFQRLQSRLVTLKIAVANSGLATAEDVTVRVKLPHTVRPLTAEEDSVVNEGAPQEPDPPPVSRGGILDAIGLLRGTRLTASRLPSLPSIPIEASRVRGPSFKKEDGESYVFYHIAQLVPQLPERDLEPFQVLIDEKAEVDQLDLDLEFYGSNLPEPQRQRLSVRLSERLMPH